MIFEEVVRLEEVSYQEFERIVSECNSTNEPFVPFAEDNWKRGKRPARFNPYED